MSEKKNIKEKAETKKVKRFGYSNYPIGAFLIMLKNAAIAKKHIVEFQSIKLINAVAESLKREGYLDEITVKDGAINVRLAYRKKEPLLMNVVLISKPGMRVYIDSVAIKNRKKPSLLIISTSAGVLSQREAIKKNLGGEVIAEIL